jgi:hypothetical protein
LRFPYVQNLQEMKSFGTAVTIGRTERNKLLKFWDRRDLEIRGDTFDPPVSGWVSGFSKLITARKVIANKLSRSLGSTIARGVRAIVQITFPGEIHIYFPIDGIADHLATKVRFPSSRHTCSSNDTSLATSEAATTEAATSEDASSIEEASSSSTSSSLLMSVSPSVSTGRGSGGASSARPMVKPGVLHSYQLRENQSVVWVQVSTRDAHFKNAPSKGIPLFACIHCT